GSGERMTLYREMAVRQLLDRCLQMRPCWKMQLSARCHALLFSRVGILSQEGLFGNWTNEPDVRMHPHGEGMLACPRIVLIWSHLMAVGKVHFTARLSKLYV
ncbi:hypothetical protein JI435_155720, partial [Parastagonospora nodorum SN15]